MLERRGSAVEREQWLRPAAAVGVVVRAGAGGSREEGGGRAGSNGTGGRLGTDASPLRFYRRAVGPACLWWGRLGLA